MCVRGFFEARAAEALAGDFLKRQEEPLPQWKMVSRTEAEEKKAAAAAATLASLILLLPLARQTKALIMMSLCLFCAARKKPRSVHPQQRIAHTPHTHTEQAKERQVRQAANLVHAEIMYTSPSTTAAAPGATTTEGTATTPTGAKCGMCVCLAIKRTIGACKHAVTQARVWYAFLMAPRGEEKNFLSHYRLCRRHRQHGSSSNKCYKCTETTTNF